MYVWAKTAHIGLSTIHGSGIRWGLPMYLPMYKGVPYFIFAKTMSYNLKLISVK